MIDLIRKQQILADLRYLSKHLDQTLIYPVPSPPIAEQVNLPNLWRQDPLHLTIQETSSMQTP